MGHPVAAGSVAPIRLCRCSGDAAGAGAHTDGLAVAGSHRAWTNKQATGSATRELAEFFLESKTFIQRGWAWPKGLHPV